MPSATTCETHRFLLGSNSSSNSDYSSTFPVAFRVVCLETKKRTLRQNTSEKYCRIISGAVEFECGGNHYPLFPRWNAFPGTMFELFRLALVLTMMVHDY